MSPCLTDRFEESGAARGHYFHQDLLVAQRIFDSAPARHVDMGSRIDGFVAHVASFREPEQRDLRENLPFERDGVRQHDVKGRQSIGGDYQQMLGIRIVDVTDLSLVNFLQAAQSRLEKRCRLRNLLHACAASRLLPLWWKAGDCGGTRWIGQRE